MQQEWHHKTITDTLTDEEYDLTGGYLQSGYFFHNLIPAIPESLEFAARYAFVEEPNKEDLAIDNDRQELHLARIGFLRGTTIN